MTPQDIITEARLILLDNDPLGYRQSDSELLLYVNEALNEIADLAPSYYQTVGDFTCQGLSSEQTLSFSDARRFQRVIRIKNGTAVPECDMDTLDRYDPAWSLAAAGPAVNWMSGSNEDQRRFYITPPAPNGQVLEVQYVKNPATYALTDTIGELPSTCRPALANYVVGRSESKDDEHVNSGRAVAFLTLFRNYFAPPAPAIPKRG